MSDAITETQQEDDMHVGEKRQALRHDQLERKIIMKLSIQLQIQIQIATQIQR